jgi:hypothetical protein
MPLVKSRREVWLTVNGDKGFIDIKTFNVTDIIGQPSVQNNHESTQILCKHPGELVDILEEVLHAIGNMDRMQDIVLEYVDDDRTKNIGTW